MCVPLQVSARCVPDLIKHTSFCAFPIRVQSGHLACGSAAFFHCESVAQHLPGLCTSRQSCHRSRLGHAAPTLKHMHAMWFRAVAPVASLGVDFCIKSSPTEDTKVIDDEQTELKVFRDHMSNTSICRRSGEVDKYYSQNAAVERSLIETDLHLRTRTPNNSFRESYRAFC